MGAYLGFAFVLILIFLLLSPRAKTKETINSLASFNVGTIMALQGRYS
jgi:hypothetical protein